MANLMEKTKIYTFIDLFAGAEGLSEGFVRAGFTPLAHIEMDKNACNTLKTRSAFIIFRKMECCQFMKIILNIRKKEHTGKNCGIRFPKA